MPRYLAPLTIAFVTLSGCRSNPLRCEDHIGHNCELPPITIDGQQGCIANEDCREPDATVCNLSINACVQCTAAQPAACIGTTPLCDTDNTCHSCTAHAQ